MNRVTMVGRMTRDPELRNTTTGKQVANFGLAVDRRFKSEDQTADFFNVVVWGQSAEYTTSYGVKGRLLSVDGRLQSRKYTNKDGVEVTSVEIVAENVSFLDKPKDEAAPEKPKGKSSGPDDYDPFGDE